MKKKILVSRKQLNEMCQYFVESMENGYVYMDSSSTLPSQDGLERTSANGGCPDWRNIEKIEPTSTDQVSSMLCPMRSMRGTTGMGVSGCNKIVPEDDVMDEAVEMDGGMVGIGDDDLFNSQQLDALSDGNSENDTSVLNNSILVAIDRLLKLTANLPDKKKAMVLNKLIESFDMDQIPHTWKRQMIQKIWNATPGEFN